MDEQTDNGTTVGQRIRVVREALGLKANDFERRIANTQDTTKRSGQISRLENGEREPTFRTLRAVVRASGCAPAYLLLGVGSPFGSESPPPPNLQEAARLLGDEIPMGAVMVARRMAAVSPVDLGMAEWMLILRDLASKL